MWLTMAAPRLLVACEYSQTVTSAFLNRGWDAYSCDLLPCEGKYPVRHYQNDAQRICLNQSWDLIIAHPPCTYLTATQARKYYHNGLLYSIRFEKMLLARDFFMFFVHCLQLPRAIENPRPLKVCALPRETQVVCPTMFGDIYTKRTYLWLYDLPPLLPITAKPLQTKQWVKYKKSPHDRSKLSPYLANAMAEQWSPLFGL